MSDAFAFAGYYVTAIILALILLGCFLGGAFVLVFKAIFF